MSGGETGYVHLTGETTILGRTRYLCANDDFSDLLLIDHGGGFSLDREHAFLVIKDLIETIARLQRGV